MVYLLVIALSLLPFAKGLPEVAFGVITFNFYMVTILFTLAISLFRNGTMLRKYQIGSTDIFIVALGITYLFSTLNSPKILDAGFLAFHGLFMPFAAFYIIKSIVVDERGYKIAFYGFLTAIMIFGVAELVVLLQIRQRPMAFMVPPISGATLLLVPTLFLLFYIKIKRSIRYPAFMLSLASMFSTLPRVYLLYVLVAGFVHKRIKRGQGLLLVILLIVGTLLGTLLLIKFSQLLGAYHGVNQEGKKDLARLVNLNYWVYALQARANSYLDGLIDFKKHIFFGVGLYRGEVNITRHNFHIEWLEYGGLIGYVLYAAVFISHFFRVTKAAVNDSYIAINLTILLGVLLNSVTNGFMHGLMPDIAFILMGFNESRLIINHNLGSIYKKKLNSVGNEMPEINDISNTRILPRKPSSILKHKVKSDSLR